MRERHKERRSRHSENMNSVIGAPDLLDFLAQDGSNMFCPTAATVESQDRRYPGSTLGLGGCKIRRRAWMG